MEVLRTKIVMLPSITLQRLNCNIPFFSGAGNSLLKKLVGEEINRRLSQVDHNKVARLERAIRRSKYPERLRKDLKKLHEDELVELYQKLSSPINDKGVETVLDTFLTATEGKLNNAVDLFVAKPDLKTLFDGLYDFFASSYSISEEVVKGKASEEICSRAEKVLKRVKAEDLEKVSKEAAEKKEGKIYSEIFTAAARSVVSRQKTKLSSLADEIFVLVKGGKKNSEVTNDKIKEFHEQLISIAEMLAMAKKFPKDSTTNNLERLKKEIESEIENALGKLPIEIAHELYKTEANLLSNNPKRQSMASVVMNRLFGALWERQAEKLTSELSKPNLAANKQKELRDSLIKTLNNISKFYRNEKKTSKVTDTTGLDNKLQETVKGFLDRLPDVQRKVVEPAISINVVSMPGNVTPVR